MTQQGQQREAVGVYDPDMTPELAQLGIRAAQEKAKEFNGSASVAVVDAGGRLAAFLRGHQVSPYSFEMTVGRAVAAVVMRRRTAELLGDDQASRDRLQAFQESIRDPFTPLPGGAPVTHKGRLIGAVSCGGAPRGQDQACADHAAAEIERALAG